MVMEKIEKYNPRIATNFRRIATKLLFVAISFLFVAISGRAASAATLYFSPSSGTYSTGRNLTVNVRVESSASMNAASGVIIFPTDKLEVLGVSKAASIFNLWVQEPSFSNRDSNVRFEGIVLNPGFSGDGKLMSITFRVKSSGAAALNFSSGSVLANDGLGTNILSDLESANFTLSAGAVLAPEEIAAPSRLPAKPLIKHEIKDRNGDTVLFRDSEGEEKWTNNRYSKLSWATPTGVTGVSYLFNDRPSSNPGSKSDGFFDNKVYENLDDGIYYAHMRFLNSLGAGPIEHFKLMIDATPPEPFEIVLPDGKVTANPTPRIRFETSDNLSGIDRYETKIDNGEWFNAAMLKTASYLLPKLKPGEHEILVRAYDKAGNYAEAKATATISPITSPKITEYPNNIISPGEKLVIKGEALPKATVEIHMIKRGKEPIVFNAEADENGNWEAIYENIISSGTYEVWAKQILDTGAESLQSNSVYIGVNSWFWKTWQWLKNVGGIIVLALIFLAILAAIAYYLWHRFKLWRIKLKREIHEAESAVASGFKKLKKEIKSGKTSSKILKNLSEIEKNIEKEIKDIERK